MIAGAAAPRFPGDDGTRKPGDEEHLHNLDPHTGQPALRANVCCYPLQKYSRKYWMWTNLDDDGEFEMDLKYGKPGEKTVVEALRSKHGTPTFKKVRRKLHAPLHFHI